MNDSWLDLRSDTVTRPTESMRQAMYRAEVGDDVLGEDPSVNALEGYAAELVGKEASLFVPSGTFGNQLALFTHCRRGEEVILSDAAHVVQHEAGAASVIAGVQLRTILPRDSYPRWNEIDPLIRKEEDIHFPDTGLIEVENAVSDGEVMSLENMREIAEGAGRFHIPVHLDGARIFNAAHFLGAEAVKLAALADSVMFCLSKGLCAPVGSILAGNKAFIQDARKKRKIMGGGMRQAGIIAAAGIIALKEQRPRLGEDHAKALALAEVFRKTGLFEISPDPVKINIFFVRFRNQNQGLETNLVKSLKTGHILTYPPEQGWIRFVTHHDLSMEEVEQVCREIEPIVEHTIKRVI